jgi:hypothetical protein
MKKHLLAFLFLMPVFSALAGRDTLRLENNRLRIAWAKTNAGWKIARLQIFARARWLTLSNPSGEYTLLYSSEKPSDAPDRAFKTVTGTTWPDTAYRYQISAWNQAVSPVALNSAGTAVYFYPASAKILGRNSIAFISETPLATISSIWQLDESYPGDIRVSQSMVCKKAGYYSLASPALLTVGEKDMAWATVPGYFQGKEMQKNFILSYAYGQGIPDLPALYRERCASALCPIITNREKISVSVIPEPGLGRDPWAADKNTHQDWCLAISHKNRRAQLSPTLYYPVLGEPKSQLGAGSKISYRFRYSLMNGEWWRMLEHAVEDVYDFKEGLGLRRNRESLVGRIEQMRKYLSDRKTSLWNVEEYKGLKIGGQSYLGGVVGSNRDAIKNSDYGAMWMMANISNDHYLKDSVLPYALNFKLAQQQTEPGFFRGAAMGQYYLSNSKRFTEEWGEFVEPMGLTYYTILDIGNILLFEPGNAGLKKRLALGADLLLKWQKPDGSWEVAYDRHTQRPLFTDLKDLRPTFYGLLVAYRILQDKKYLDAAKRGADWFIRNAVEKGSFIGVCGDARYAPDFATGQSAQALLDLYDLTRNKKYETAAIRTARMYMTSIYTHPVPSRKMKLVNGIPREDWQIAQAGLSFEHGGIIGSANGAGPILLCSHAGMFVRVFQLTGDSLFLYMARAAAIGRDAFVDSATGVASYYWKTMNRGAGPYPHHAWWQIGWITDYIMAEAQFRTSNAVIFPRGFITPKVGPHESYGFAPGRIFGEPARLIIRQGLVELDNPDIEYITAVSEDKKKLFVVVLNDIGEKTDVHIRLDTRQLGAGIQVGSIKELTTGEHLNSLEKQVELNGYGIRVYSLNLTAG